ncbi:MAG TPA: holin [Roseateles sp.]
MNSQTDADAAAAASAALKTTLIGAAGVGLGGLTDSQVAMVGGLVIAGAGLLLQGFFQWRRDRREEVEHRARMRALTDEERAS